MIIKFGKIMIENKILSFGRRIFRIRIILNDFQMKVIMASQLKIALIIIRLVAFELSVVFKSYPTLNVKI